MVSVALLSLLSYSHNKVRIGDFRTLCYHVHMHGHTYAVQHSEGPFEWLALNLGTFIRGKTTSEQ